MLINPYRFTPVDPNFSSVSLLLHGDGINGSTTITDSSSSPKTVTAFGNAQISTAQSKFGGASISFDGSGDYLSTPSNASLQVLLSDFTLEGWFRLAASQNDYCIFSTYGDSAIGETQVCGYIVRLTSTAFRFFAGGGTGGIYNVIADRTFSFNVGQWYHFAVAVVSNIGRIFIDGTQQGLTFTLSSNVANSSQTLQIGRVHTDTLDFNGQLDDLRITKGVARYTSSFTPPSAPFPDR